MLSSKDVLERTGISRATLNNYIGTGLVPRPDVLPPQEGGAPRIGYFPDDTVERIAQIQRLKQEGWSIARIAAHFAGGDAAPAPPRAPTETPEPRGRVPATPTSGASPAYAPPGIERAPAPEARRIPAPILTPVAVLVSTLQDAPELWLQLPAGEYFELVNEVWLALDRIFSQLGGRHGKHPGEGMVCHFLPQGSPGYLWNALSAAFQARQAMHQINTRWQARKGWDLELCMNTGVDEGQEWLGALRLSDPLELTVVGGAAEHAAQMSRLARTGSIWVTRNLVGKLNASERERLTFGVPRRDRPVLASFARLQELAALDPRSGPVPPALADLAATELLDLASGPAAPVTPPGDRPA